MHRAEPISTETAEHYTWGGVCDGWHLLTNPTLSVIQERVPPGAGEVRHFHSAARQFFYVLNGTATIEFETGTATLRPGEGLEVSPRPRRRGIARTRRNDPPRHIEAVCRHGS